MQNRSGVGGVKNERRGLMFECGSENKSPVIPCCPLTPALTELLQACVDTGSGETSILAAALCRTPGTVRTDFKRTFVVLAVHDRVGAVLKALRHGWIHIPEVGQRE